MSYTPGLWHSPSTATAHGRVLSVCAFFAGSSLPVPNS